MNKVFVLAPSEDWIVDRFVKEWREDNQDINIDNPYHADVVWLLADWCWKHLDKKIFETKKVLTTVHHIVPEKFFGTSKQQDFIDRDKITTAYHVYNEISFKIVKSLTNKPVHLIPYWANQKIWKKTGSKLELRKKYNLPINNYLIGSFQRDTEGHDLISPKLEKGPDLLADFIQYKANLDTTKNVHVVLAGWRRQYIINRLVDAKIPYSYFERPIQPILNDLYQTLDLYPITSRYEGGPQSLIECGLLDIPVISRNVGIANSVLDKSSINDDIHLAIPSIPKVENLFLPKGYIEYRNLLINL